MEDQNKNGNVVRPGATAIIEDGYNIEAFIRARQGLHPDINFVFRPALDHENTKLILMSQNSIDDNILETYRFVVAHLKSWDVSGHDGKVKEISTENFGKLKQAVINRMTEIVQCKSPSDAKPEWDEDIRKERSDEDGKTDWRQDFDFDADTEAEANSPEEKAVKNS